MSALCRPRQRQPRNQNLRLVHRAMSQRLRDVSGVDLDRHVLAEVLHEVRVESLELALRDELLP